MQFARRSFLVRMIVIVVLATGSDAAVIAQSSDGTLAGSARQPPLTVAFQGAVPFGLVNTAVQAPGESSGGFNSIDSGWGAGLTIEYALVPELRLFIDGNHFTYRKQVGVAGQNSSGDWVFEMTGYSTNQLSFSQDAFFDMSATGIRAGLKAVLPLGSMQPWGAVGYGYYRWDASYETSDRSGSWGSAGGYVWGLTYMAGMDWWMSLSKKNDMFFRIYADLTAPAVFPVINDLFRAGWTWDNSGGNNIMGAYRFGIAIGMPL